jgi:predicted Fe-Mo cluster-binding NifX family protein
MKIAVSASGPDLEARVDPRFGRAPYFLLVDSDTMAWEVISNSLELQAAHGAGIQAATQVARNQPSVVLTGNCAPKAFRTLQSAGIKVIIGVAGVVKDVVYQYGQGQYQPIDRPNVSGHWDGADQASGFKTGSGRMAWKGGCTMMFAQRQGGGGGGGGGAGRGGSGQGSGRGVGSRPGPGGMCLCPACGEKAAHQQGTPCIQMKCPKCGAAMVRE